jgi:glutamyl-tRNA synthetase
MLAVVVDDHDMGVTHVIRGDDHLGNTARQALLYHAMGWELPVFAHIPLIHGADGKKLSKRHGALGVEEYRAMGFIAPGLRNYLTRLGWSHGDDEVFTTEQALEWFGFDGMNKAPARLDLKKLENVNGQHIAMSEDAALLQAVAQFLTATGQPALTEGQRDGLSRAMPQLKDRAKTVPDLLEKGHFILTSRPIVAEEKAAKALDPVSRGILSELTPHLQTGSWTREMLERELPAAAERHGIGFGKLAAPLRAALAGRAATPSVYDMMLVLGREESLARIQDASAA